MLFLIAVTSKGELWTSVNYGQSFASRSNYGNGQYFSINGVAISSDGSKAIAAVAGLGNDTYPYSLY